VGHLDTIADMAQADTSTNFLAVFFINEPHIHPRNREGLVHSVLDVATPRVVSMPKHYEKIDFSEFGDEKGIIADAVKGSLKWQGPMNIYTRAAAT